MLREVLKYAQGGLCIIPVGKDKKPLISWKEYQERLPTIEELTKWWTDFPDAQIGMITGKISKIIVVDVEAGGETDYLPETATSKTGGGGRHFFYAWVDFIPNAARIRPLTDIRGDGGYVILPPSESFKGKYEWLKKIHPLPFFPKHLFGDNSTFKKTDWVETMKGVGQGERNQTAAQVAGKFIKTFGLEKKDAAWQSLIGWNSFNTPPLSERELQNVFQSILNRENRKPQEKISTNTELEIISNETPIVSLREAVEAQKEKEKSDIIPLGYPVFDSVIKGGVKNGNLIVISGSTGMGKTFLAQNLTYNFLKQGFLSLWFSFEVLYEDLMEKFIEIGLKETNLIFVPFKTPTGSIEWIEQKINEAQDKMIKFVFIDHLGFLTSRKIIKDFGSSPNYAAYLQAICRELKHIAVERKLIIILMTHAKKIEGEMELSDIKDSSGIAQESDLTFLVEREKTLSQGDNDDFTPYSRIKLSKNRPRGIHPRAYFYILNGRLEHDPIYTGLKKNNSIKRKYGLPNQAIE